LPPVFTVMLKRSIVCLVGILPFLCEAQSFYAIRRPRNITVLGGSGIASYKGELVNPKDFGRVRYNIVAGAEYLMTNRISIKAELTWFSITGSDKDANDDRRERNLSFMSNNQELSAEGVFYFLQDAKEYFKRRPVNFYAFAGVGLLHMNPKAEFEGKKYALQPLQTEGIAYSRFQLSVPYGVGVRLSIGPLQNIMIEGGYRTTFTDHLDDISIRRYPDASTLIGGADGIAAKLSDRRRERDPEYPIQPGLGVRGNAQQNDGYFLMNIKYQYYLPYDIGPNSEARKFYRQKRRK